MKDFLSSFFINAIIFCYEKALNEKINDEVKKFLLEMVWGGRIDLGPDAMAVNLRHRSSLERVKASLEQFMQTLDNSCELELLSFDLREGLDRIDEVLGVTADEDVLEQIFAEFCIGK